MNRERYLRELGAHVPRAERARVVEAAREELRALEAEAVAEGLTAAAAADRAIQLHRAPRLAWTPWRTRSVLLAPVQRATWMSALYLALLFPVGLVAGIWAVAGLTVVASLSLIGIGLLLAVPYLLSLRPLARLFGAVATWATGQPMPTLGMVPRAEGPLLARIRARIQDPETLVAWAMCIVASVLGQAAVAWVAGTGSVVVFLLGSPFIEAIPPMPGGGAVYPDVLLASAAVRLATGIVLLWVWSWGCQVLAWTFARITRGVLTRT